MECPLELMIGLIYMIEFPQSSLISATLPHELVGGAGSNCTGHLFYLVGAGSNCTRDN